MIFSSLRDQRLDIFYRGSLYQLVSTPSKILKLSVFFVKLFCYSTFKGSDNLNLIK